MKLQNLTKTLVLPVLLCLGWGVANAQDMYISPTGDITNWTIGESTDAWSFNWNATDWGTTLNGITFNMKMVDTPSAPVILSLYATADEGRSELLATDSLSYADFCAQYTGTCGTDSAMLPIQFTFADPATMSDETRYTAVLSYFGSGAGTYVVGLSTGEDSGAGVATPEPATMAMMGGALIVLSLGRKRLMGKKDA